MINSQIFYAGREKRAVCLQGGGGPQVGEVTGAYMGKPACRYNLSFWIDHVYMIGGVTRRSLPRLPEVPHLHVNRP